MADIKVHGLTIEYQSGPYAVRPVDGLDLALGTGELVVLLGASGCGKTSLLSVLAGILTPTAGSIEVAGRPIDRLSDAELTRYRRDTVGVVFQSFNLVPSLTALENVSVPLWSAGTKGRAAAERATALLELVGLGERLHHRPSEMSGGQQQRVAIARALAHDPPVLLADEPTAHLDSSSVQDVMNVLRGLAVPGRLVVIATHDHRMIPLADRVVELTPKGASTTPERARRRRLKSGQVLFREGDAGELVFLVEQGSVALTKELRDGGQEQVAAIGPGNYFGELAPLLQMPRSATATAEVDDTVVLGMTVSTFRKRTALVEGEKAKPLARRSSPRAPKARAARPG